MKPWFAFLIWLSLGLLANGKGMPPPMVNLTTYRSPSGKYALEVDPTDLYGRGEARCKLSTGGREVWSKLLPFTFSEALVTEEGLVAGYGYSEGIQGWPRDPQKKGSGELAVAILDPAGAFRLEEKKARMRSRVLHGGAVPTIGHLLLHPEHNRFAVHLYEEGNDYWQPYELSTGKRGARFEIKAQGENVVKGRALTAAHAVAGTPLSLAHWHCYNDTTRQPGSLFTLFDLEGRQVWQLARPDDYGDSSKKSDAEQRLVWQAQREGGILDTAQPGMFDLRLFREKQRAIHTVKRDGEGWKVEQIGLRPYAPPAEEKVAAPKAAAKPLEVLGKFTLSDRAADGGLGDISAWGFDGEGRIGLLRESGKDSAFVLLDSAGKRLSTVKLPDSEEATLHLAWVKGDRWVLTVTPVEGKQARAWWLDAKLKTRTELAGFSCPEIQSLAGSGDGGFIALATDNRLATSKDNLIAFDAEGRRRWARVQYEQDGPDELSSPKAVTVTTRGEIALLNNVVNSVQIFDLKGAYLRTIELKKAWKREPNYPSEIMADRDGGFVVFDFDAPKPFVWMKGDGTVREQFHPRYADGRSLPPKGGLGIAPDGQAWSCDGQAFYRLTAERRAGQTLGAAPNPEALQKLGEAAVDAAGQLYLVDARSAAVHVFDAEGRKVHVMKPEKGDFGRELEPKIAVAPDGIVYLGGLGRNHSVHFAPDGTRLGTKQSLKLDEIREGWFPRAVDRGMIVVGYECAFLVDKDDAVARKIERRADRQWLGHPEAAAPAADGSFALTSSQRMSGKAGDAIDFFSASGDPLATGFLPERWSQLCGYNGRHAVLQTEDEIWLYDRKGTPVLRFSPEANREKWDWQPFLTRDGRELWVLEKKARKVTRYAMPAE